MVSKLVDDYGFFGFFYFPSFSVGDGKLCDQDKSFTSFHLCFLFSYITLFQKTIPKPFASVRQLNATKTINYV